MSKDYSNDKSENNQEDHSNDPDGLEKMESFIKGREDLPNLPPPKEETPPPYPSIDLPEATPIIDRRDFSKKEPMPSEHITINPTTISKPIVIMVGPGNVGKTVALLRFARYLVKHDCTVSVNKNFASGATYAKSAEYFKDILYDQTARIPDRTASGNYLLLDVHQGNEFLFQILEVPGEDIYSINNQARNQTIQGFMNQILNKDIPKIYLLFFSPDMLANDRQRGEYDQRLQTIFRQKFKPARGDHFIMLYNKVDDDPNLFGIGGEINEKQLKINIRNSFPMVAASIDAISSKHKKTHISFLPFTSGSFSGEQWQEESNDYPERLWGEVQQCLPREETNLTLILVLLAVILLVAIVVFVIMNQ